MSEKLNSKKIMSNLLIASMISNMGVSVSNFQIFADSGESETIGSSLTEETTGSLFKSARAQIDDLDAQSLEYNFNDRTSTATVIGCDNLDIKQIRIPTTVENEGITYKVTAIGENAFENLKLELVVIPESVTTIGNYAFAHNESLKEIEISNGVTTIGNYAFAYNEKLKEIIIPDSVTDVGDGAFAKCIELESIKISEELSQINQDTFLNCKMLKSITIPGNVKSIGYRAFNSCNKLVEVELFDGVEEIGKEAFEFCKSLNHIDIPSSVREIGEDAFYGCAELEIAMLLSDNIKLDASIFNKCDKLAIIRIMKNTDYGNTLREYYGDKVVEIDEDVYYFDNCKYKLNDSDLTAILMECQNKEIKKVYIPESIRKNGKTYKVVRIFKEAFSENIELQSITLPNSIKKIDLYAFKGCKKLTVIDIPESVTEVGYRAFINCSALTSINIPNGVTTLGEYTFDGCSMLTSVKINAKELKIEDGVFDNCPNLTKFIISYKSNFEQILRNIKPNAEIIYFDFLRLSDCIYELDSDAKTAILVKFDNSKLQKIDIPESVEKDGQNYKVVAIGDSAFKGEAVSIPGGTISDSDELFKEGQQLTSVTIPKTVTSIGKSAFENCVNLTSVVIPNGVTKLSDSIFANCLKLTSITIPQTLTKIDAFAFYNCRKLPSINIPEGVTEIGKWAFFNCIALETMIIPSTVTKLGDAILAYTWSLKTLKILPKNIDVGNNSDRFRNMGSSVTVYLPSDTNYEQYLPSKIKKVYINASNNTSSSNTNSGGFQMSDTSKTGNINVKLKDQSEAKGVNENNTSQDSELLIDKENNGNISFNLCKEINLNNVDSSQISDNFKSLTKNIISNLETVLKVQPNSSKSLVLDVTGIYDDVSMNDIILKLDNMYKDKEIYISCIYDENNVFYLNSNNQWEKRTDGTKELQYVKVGADNLFKFIGINKKCVFVVTIKN